MSLETIEIATDGGRVVLLNHNPNRRVHRLIQDACLECCTEWPDNDRILSILIDIHKELE